MAPSVPVQSLVHAIGEPFNVFIAEDRMGLGAWPALNELGRKSKWMRIGRLKRCTVVSHLSFLLIKLQWFAVVSGQKNSPTAFSTLSPASANICLMGCWFRAPS